MKELLIIFFLTVSLFSFSQTESDYKMIIQQVIEKYDSSSVKVYKKFVNHSKIELIEHYKLRQDNQLINKYSDQKDSLKFIFIIDVIDSYWQSDTASIKIENIEIDYLLTKNYLESTNQKRINKFFDSDNYEKRKKVRPIVFLSFPILSRDNRKALVYDSHVNGPLSGSGGVYFLEKVHDKWKIVGWEVREIY